MLRSSCGSRFQLTIEALLTFVLLDIGFLLFGFPQVYRFVGCRSREAKHRDSIAYHLVMDAVVEAVRRATRYYWRRRLDCLPRSLTIYLLLRRRNIPATLRIGVKRYPFGAHAWVECEGRVLDDLRSTWRREPYVPIISV